MKNSSFHKLLTVIAIIMITMSCQAQRQLFSIYQTEHWLPAFGEGFQRALYKGTLDIRDNHLTGLMVIKRTSDTSVRVVFTNEIGMKFFDLEFAGEKFIKHFVFASMNKGALISIIENDLKMVLMEDYTIENFSKEPKEDIVFYKIQSKRGNNLYTIDNNSKRIKTISSAGKKVKKTLVNFRYGESDIPTGIVVDNPFIKLHLVMNLLEDK